MTRRIHTARFLQNGGRRANSSPDPQHRRAELTRAYYEQAGLWSRDHSAIPSYREKTEVFKKIIPPGVRSVLDVGCGNGAIANVLAEEYSVVGLDASRTALTHLRTPTIEASATAMPVESDSFDLALCSEMLEHLNEDDFRKTIKEIKRVATRYILISVPNDEDIAQRHVECPRCGASAHVYDHVQSFDVENATGMFLPEYRAAAIKLCGEHQPPNYPKWLLRIRQERLGVFWRVTDNCFPMCLLCGNTDYRPRRPIADFLGRSITTLACRILTSMTPRRLDWIVVLYEKLTNHS